MTFDELTDAIQQYLDNTEATFVANIPLFVRLAEERIYRSVQLQAIQSNATSTVTSGSPYLTVPAGFLSPLEFTVTSSSEQFFLYPKDVSFIRAAYPASSTQGRPRYYALFDADTIIMGPTPDQSYACELHYIKQPESITEASSGETWLGTYGEQALLYGSLVQAYAYMKGDEDLQKEYERLYQEALVRLKVLAEGDNRRDSFRNPEQSINSGT